VAARGIDVAGITHVIQFDIPATQEDYVHRVGRTARAGATGVGLTFVLQDQASELVSMVDELGLHSELELGGLMSDATRPRPAGAGRPGGRGGQRGGPARGGSPRGGSARGGSGGGSSRGGSSRNGSARGGSSGGASSGVSFRGASAGSGSSRGGGRSSGGGSGRGARSSGGSR
jgi:hypothetical protein